MVALIAAAGLNILRQVLFAGQAMAPQNVQWAGLALFAAAFCLLRWRKWNPILVMSLCGAGGLALGLLAG